MPKSPHMSRREFVSIVTAAAGTVMGAIIGIPAIGYLIAPALQKVTAEAWIPVGPVSNFQVGVPSLFNFNRTTISGWVQTVNSYGVYIVKQQDGSLLALSNKCTHLSCRVNWKQEDSAYVCPCHDAWFAINGDKIKGPQPRALDKYEAKIENDTLSIHFVGS